MVGEVPDPKKMPALLELLRCYASGDYSYQSLADHLNGQGYRNREGALFYKGSVEHVLSNRFYIGESVYHPGKADEEVTEGTHELPPDAKELWLKCQEVKKGRVHSAGGRPRGAQRAYPFTRIAVCDGCNQPYGGQPVHRKAREVIRRLSHRRPFCSLTPHSVRVEYLMDQFQDDVVPFMRLDSEWQDTILKALEEDSSSGIGGQRASHRSRLEKALENLRKQHLWGDVSDDQYRAQREILETELRGIGPALDLANLPSLSRSAQLLQDLPALWRHPGVTDGQRERAIREMFTEVRLRGKEIIALRPRPIYQPLFAHFVTQGVRKCRGEWIRTTGLHVPNVAR